MGFDIVKAKVVAVVAAGLITVGAGLTEAPVAMASPLFTAGASTSHTVHTVREVAKIGGKRYTVNFLTQRLSGSKTYFYKLVVRDPHHKALYSTKLTGGQYWAVHTIWAEREEPLYFRSFSSQKQLLHTVRGEVAEGKRFAHELEF